MFGKKKDVSGLKLYDLCNSQNGMYLMYKFNLQKQQVQIPTSITVDRELDFDLLQKAFDMEIERNESFRLTATNVSPTDTQNPSVTENNGVFTISGITDDVEISVTGIVDVAFPTAEITVATNKWSSFLEGITFGIFFKETQTF